MGMSIGLRLIVVDVAGAAMPLTEKRQGRIDLTVEIRRRSLGLAKATLSIERCLRIRSLSTINLVRAGLWPVVRDP